MSNTFNSSSTVKTVCAALTLSFVLELRAGVEPPEAIPTGEDWTVKRLQDEFCGPDPWEGFNRTMFAIDELAMDWGADPLCYLYCSVIPRPLNDGIENAANNIEYPIRLFASLFRGEWGCAWDETCRFGINSTIGLGGLFDPSSHWFAIFDTGASMSGTLAAWHVAPGPTLVIPFIPRSNVRDVSGRILDYAFDPKTYFDIFFPTDAIIGWSACFWPTYAASWIDPWQSSLASEADRYTAYRQLFTLKSHLDEDFAIYRHLNDIVAGTAEERRPPVRAEIPRPQELYGRWLSVKDFNPRTPALDSLRIKQFNPRRDEDIWWMRHSVFNGDFAKDVQHRTVTIEVARPDAAYGFVPAPERPNGVADNRIFFIIPGIAGAYDSNATLAMAEVLNDAGAAVVLCDNPFHWRYMLSGNHRLLPGYLPDDAIRYADFIQFVLDDLEADGLIRAPEVSVVGWSMGGLTAAHLANLDFNHRLTFRTGRFLAVNPPVSFGSILNRMEAFLAPTRGWSRETFKSNFMEITRRLMAWNELRLCEVPDISEEDARFVAALSLGVSLPTLVRLNSDADINVSARDYVRLHLARQYPERSARDIEREAGLETLGPMLQAQSKLAVIHSWDDFLLSPDDRRFLDHALKDRISWFSVGAHCGQFYTEEFKDELLNRLALQPQ